MNKLIKKSFTLIELLVVIAIIGILSGLIIVGMNGMTQKATIAKAQVFSNSLRNSLMMNLVSEWKFDNITDYDSGTKVIGTLSDNIPDTWGAFGYNHGTASGGPILKDGNDCISGKCIQFDGTNDYVDCGAFQYLEVFTLEAWIKAGTDISVYRTIIDKTISVSSRNYWLNLYSGTGRLSLRFSVGGTGDEFTGTAALNDNVWHHVVATYDNSYVKLYVDGNSNMTPASKTGVPDNPTVNNYIGYQPSTPTRVFNGLIDDVRIYKAAILTSQIKEQYYVGLNNLLFSGQIDSKEYNQRINLIAHE